MTTLPLPCTPPDCVAMEVEILKPPDGWGDEGGVGLGGGLSGRKRKKKSIRAKSGEFWVFLCLLG